MIRRRWILVLVAAVVAIFGFLLFLEGLENADRYSSVIAAAAGVIGLAISLLTVLRPESSSSETTTGTPVFKVDHGTMHVYRQNRANAWYGPALLLAGLLLVAASLVPGDLPPATSAPGLDEVPLHVAVEQFDYVCGVDWLAPQSPDQLRAAGPVPSRWSDWDAVADGAPVGRSGLLVTVQARSDTSVTLTRLDVSVERMPPLTGTLLSKPCGDAATGRRVEIDLDDPTPVPVGHGVDPDKMDLARAEGLRVDPVQFPYEVTRQDAETFAIQATTGRCFCRWTAELRWSSAGRTGTITIDNDGQPFRVTADASTARCTVTDGGLVCG